MHDSAYKCCRDFYDKYCKGLVHRGGSKVIDFGSFDVNGCLKPIFDDAFWYTGIDMEAGKNVDVVCSPKDCWRFYIDAWKALEEWGVKNGYEVKLIEHYIMRAPKWRKAVNWIQKIYNSNNYMYNSWDDSVAIFKMS
jgi:hypothetical protein